MYNVRPSTAFLVQQFLTISEVVSLNHLPYFPDLSGIKFFGFWHQKCCWLMLQTINLSCYLFKPSNGNCTIICHFYHLPYLSWVLSWKHYKYWNYNFQNVVFNSSTARKIVRFFWKSNLKGFRIPSRKWANNFFTRCLPPYLNRPDISMGPTKRNTSVNHCWIGRDGPRWICSLYSRLLYVMQLLPFFGRGRLTKYRCTSWHYPIIATDPLMMC